MKKRILIFAIFTLSFFCFSQNNKIVGFDIGLSSGIPVYSDSNVQNYNNRVSDGKFSRIIVGAVSDISFLVCRPIKLFFGADLLCDFIWKGSDYSNHLDYAFLGGFKFYPGVGGLNASLSYCLGQRVDFYNNDVQDSIISKSAWGNGFRIGIEYDFKYNSNKKILPALGFYYRFMPRGSNTYDNIFAVYAAAVM